MMNFVDLVKNLYFDFVMLLNIIMLIFEGKCIVLIMYLYYMDLFDKMLEYVKFMLEGCDFIFIVGFEENVKLVWECCKGLFYNVDVCVI